jgi:hypothetical protein
MDEKDEVIQLLVSDIKELRRRLAAVEGRSEQSVLRSTSAFKTNPRLDVDDGSDLLPGDNFAASLSITGPHMSILASVAVSLEDDLQAIADRLNLVEVDDALRVSVRLSKLISTKLNDGAQVVIREKDGSAAELVVEPRDEEQKHGGSSEA